MPADPASARLRPHPPGPLDCLRDEPRWKDLYATARAAVATMQQIVDDEKLSRQGKAALKYAVEELGTACDEYDGTFRGRQLLPGMLEWVRGWRPRHWLGGPT